MSDKLIKYKIIQNSMDKEEVKEGILCLLQGTAPTGDSIGYTFLEIKEFLKVNNVQGYFEEGKEHWKKLKDILGEMEEENLIEERHFGESAKWKSRFFS